MIWNVLRKLLETVRLIEWEEDVRTHFKTHIGKIRYEDGEDKKEARSFSMADLHFISVQFRILSPQYFLFQHNDYVRS
jgi:hypothetical protein